MMQDNLSDHERREILIQNWVEKAHEALTAAKLLLEAGMLDAAVNRAYYACFYSLSAVLTKERKSFRKHSGVRAWLHKDMVKRTDLTPPGENSSTGCSKIASGPITRHSPGLIFLWSVT